ncbi:MAG TPA: hypothetical protein VF043_15825 [Ktedonobacteraceae bacterium]
MGFSVRSKMSVLITFVTLLVVVSGFLVTGFNRGSATQVHAANSTSNVFVRHISSGSSTSITSAPLGKDGFQAPEINSAVNGMGQARVRPLPYGATNRSGANPSAVSASVQNTGVSSSSIGLITSFNGINHRQQRLANNGNQFSLEPPDQGLCVGNGFVLETVNDALNVYDSHGNSLKGPTDLNSFYGYPPSINRTTGVFGPELTDPSCYFDKATQRWFHIVLTIGLDPHTGAFTGQNQLDLAVSRTASPLGAFTIYSINTIDDGTHGTPNHKCDSGPCLGDYPHIGADANGFYITTNEYGFFAPGLGFHAAQIYAISKQALASHASSVSVIQIDTLGLVGSPGAGLPGNPGFTVWPATSPDNQYATNHDGTEYFLSSDAAPEANGNGASRDLVVWSLSDTASLNSAKPAISLSNTVLTVNPYSIPAKAVQKKGNTPLITCLNTPSCATLVLGKPDPFTETEGPLDVNDTRMQQVTYANGRLYGALDTNLTVNNVNEAGIEWFVVNPITPRVVNQGYLGAKNANIIYPALGVTSSGKGVIAFTLVGPNNFPSAAYAPFGTWSGPGAIQIAARGLGPQDGFSETKAFSPTGNGVPRPRWGDYGAAVPVGDTVWIASEYIGQTCTYAQFTTNTPASPLFSCNMTRTSLANWYTRISLVAV